jgi:hypothetical protein
MDDMVTLQTKPNVSMNEKAADADATSVSGRATRMAERTVDMVPPRVEVIISKNAQVTLGVF